MTTVRQSSLTRRDRREEVVIGPLFFIVAILGILASAVAVGGGALVKPGAIPDLVTVKMPMEQNIK